MNVIWSSFIAALVPILVPVVVALVTIGVMFYISKHKVAVAGIESAIQMVKLIFGNKLGDKADKVFDIWLECLAKVQSGQWTTQEMLAEFFKIVDSMKDVSLTTNEKQQVTDITNASVKMLCDSPVSISSLSI
jgi:hypothetical protein